MNLNIEAEIKSRGDAVKIAFYLGLISAVGWEGWGGGVVGVGGCQVCVVIPGRTHRPTDIPGMSK